MSPEWARATGTSLLQLLLSPLRAVSPLTPAAGPGVDSDSRSHLLARQLSSPLIAAEENSDCAAGRALPRGPLACALCGRVFASVPAALHHCLEYAFRTDTKTPGEPLDKANSSANCVQGWDWLLTQVITAVATTVTTRARMAAHSTINDEKLFRALKSIISAGGSNVVGKFSHVRELLRANGFAVSTDSQNAASTSSTSASSHETSTAAMTTSMLKTVTVSPPALITSKTLAVKDDVAAQSTAAQAVAAKATVATAAAEAEDAIAAAIAGTGAGPCANTHSRARITMSSADHCKGVHATLPEQSRLTTVSTTRPKTKAPDAAQANATAAAATAAAIAADDAIAAAIAGNGAVSSAINKHTSIINSSNATTNQRTLQQTPAPIGSRNVAMHYSPTSHCAPHVVTVKPSRRASASTDTRPRLRLRLSSVPVPLPTVAAFAHALRQHTPNLPTESERASLYLSHLLTVSRLALQAEAFASRVAAEAASGAPLAEPERALLRTASAAAGGSGKNSGKDAGRGVVAPSRGTGLAVSKVSYCKTPGAVHDGNRDALCPVTGAPLGTCSDESTCARCSCAWMTAEIELTVTVTAASLRTLIASPVTVVSHNAVTRDAVRVSAYGPRDVETDSDADSDDDQSHHKHAIYDNDGGDSYGDNSDARNKATHNGRATESENVTLPAASPRPGDIVWLSLPLASTTVHANSKSTASWIDACTHWGWHTPTGAPASIALTAAQSLCAPACPPPYPALSGARPTVNAYWAHVPDSGHEAHCDHPQCSNCDTGKLHVMTVSDCNDYATAHDDFGDDYSSEEALSRNTVNARMGDYDTSGRSIPRGRSCCSGYLAASSSTSSMHAAEPSCLPPVLVCPPPLAWAPLEARVKEATVVSRPRRDSRFDDETVFDVTLAVTMPVDYARAFCTLSNQPTDDSCEINTNTFAPSQRGIENNDVISATATHAASNQCDCGLQCNHCAHLAVLSTAAGSVPLGHAVNIARDGYDHTPAASAWPTAVGAHGGVHRGPGVPWAAHSGVVLEWGPSTVTYQRTCDAAAVLSGAITTLPAAALTTATTLALDGEARVANSVAHALAATSTSYPFYCASHFASACEDDGNKNKECCYPRKNAALRTALSALSGCCDAPENDVTNTGVLELLQQPWLWLWPPARAATFDTIVTPILSRILPELSNALSAHFATPYTVVPNASALAAAILSGIGHALATAFRAGYWNRVKITLPLPLHVVVNSTVHATPAMALSLVLDGVASLTDAAVSASTRKGFGVPDSEPAVTMLALLPCITPPRFLLRPTPMPAAAAMRADWTTVLRGLTSDCGNESVALKNTLAWEKAQVALVSATRTAASLIPPPPSLDTVAKPATENAPMWRPYLDALNLNDSQRDAVLSLVTPPQSRDIWSMVTADGSGHAALPPPLAMIQGPPGTGKTHTIAAAAWLWIRAARLRAPVCSPTASADGGEDNTGGVAVAGTRVLLSAYSNTAADLLAARVRTVAAAADAAARDALRHAKAAARDEVFARDGDDSCAVAGHENDTLRTMSVALGLDDNDRTGPVEDSILTLSRFYPCPPIILPPPLRVARFVSGSVPISVLLASVSTSGPNGTLPYWVPQQQQPVTRSHAVHTMGYVDASDFDFGPFVSAALLASLAADALGQPCPHVDARTTPAFASAAEAALSLAHAAQSLSSAVPTTMESQALAEVTVGAPARALVTLSLVAREAAAVAVAVAAARPVCVEADALWGVHAHKSAAWAPRLRQGAESLRQLQRQTRTNDNATAPIATFAPCSVLSAPVVATVINAIIAVSEDVAALGCNAAHVQLWSQHQNQHTLYQHHHPPVYVPTTLLPLTTQPSSAAAPISSYLIAQSPLIWAVLLSLLFERANERLPSMLRTAATVLLQSADVVVTTCAASGSRSLSEGRPNTAALALRYEHATLASWLSRAPGHAARACDSSASAELIACPTAVMQSTRATTGSVDAATEAAAAATHPLPPAIGANVVAAPFYGFSLVIVDETSQAPEFTLMLPLARLATATLVTPLALTRRLLVLSATRARLVGNDVAVATNTSALSELQWLQSQGLVSRAGYASHHTSPAVAAALQTARLLCWGSAGSGAAARAAFVGDHCQLPPVAGAGAGDAGLLCRADASAFARLACTPALFPFANGRDRTSTVRPTCVMLTQQHRMHSALASWPSRTFYHGRLTTPPGLDEARPPVHGFIWPRIRPRHSNVNVSQTLHRQLRYDRLQP